jgi:predicted component of type VI protein secretion system
VRQADGYYASDLESNNGTLVNEDELKAPRRLRNGDLLRVGTVELRFVSIFPHSGAPLAMEEEEPSANGGVSHGQTTIPLTRDVALPPPDENQPQQPENG